MGKPLELMVMKAIGVEVKEVSDKAVVASGSRKSVCSFAQLSNSTSGEVDKEFWTPSPPEAFEDAFEARAGSRQLRSTLQN